MGSCGETCGTRPQCGACPFKPAFGCCHLMDGCLRASAFAAQVLASVMPNYAATLAKFGIAVKAARDVTDLGTSAEDFALWGSGELFSSQRRWCQAADGASLSSSFLTPLALLAERELCLGTHACWLCPITNALSAAGHGFNLIACTAEESECQRTTTEAVDSFCECTYHLAELCDARLLAALGIITGCRKTAVKFEETATAA